ncbi:MAG: response regulator transcription factor [Lachnospiraceae bacterium]|nr:response regulator transcription factor [Lachnospiraceae bacterium]
MSNKFKVLIIEDELNICHFVKTILESNGYQVLDANSGSVGKMQFLSHCPDLVILDLGLPDMDGNELIPFMREAAATPIIVLSARSHESDKVNALDLGANDYMTKPFGTEELLARVRAALRNSRQKMGADGVVRSSYSVNGLIIEYDRRRITVRGEEVKLTQTEYNIVELLASHSGKVLTYTEIINKIWRYADPGSVKKLQVNMANIRKKLGEKPGENQYIANELGVGYRMVQEDD